MSTVFALAQIVIKELYRRKDFYVLLVLTVLITLVMGSANVFNEQQNIVRDLKEICLLLIWISALVMAVGMAARQLPAERENRTIFPLLAKPVSRAQVILGKFLGCWLASGIALVVFYFFLGVMSGSREHSWPVLDYLQALWLQWVFLAVVIALVLLGSLVFAAPSSNATICIVFVVAILIVGRHLNKVALQYHEPLASIIYTVYFLIPHLEWSDIREMVTHDRGLIDWSYVGLASLYFATYTALLLYGAWWCFRRKALS
jgi:ABC-type transport system involved in multi-copper enzyme maturation permease subunit